MECASFGYTNSPESQPCTWMCEWFFAESMDFLINGIMEKRNQLLFIGLTPGHEHHIKWGARVTYQSLLHLLGSPSKWKVGMPLRALACL